MKKFFRALALRLLKGVPVFHEISSMMANPRKTGEI